MRTTFSVQLDTLFSSSRCQPLTGRCGELVLALAVLLLIPGAGFSAEKANAELSKKIQQRRIHQEGEQQMLAVGLKDVLVLALKRSHPLQVARILEQIAQSRLRGIRESADASWTQRVEHSQNPAIISAPLSTDYFLKLSRGSETILSSLWRHTLSSGMSYGLELKDVRSGQKEQEITAEGQAPSSSAATERTLSTTSLTASLSIPFLKDAGSEINDIPERLGEVQVERSQYETLRDEQNILRGVADLYWDLVDLSEQIKVAQEAVRLSKRLLANNRARLRAGVISPTDVQISQTQLARERQLLLSFQLEAQRRADQLRTALNLDDRQWDYRPTDLPMNKREVLDPEVLAEKMRKRNPELAILQTALRGNDYHLLSAENDQQSELALEMFYTLQGYAKNTLAGTSGFSESGLAGYGATLTWSVPLFDYASDETYHEKMLERTRIELQLEQLRTGLNVRLQSTLRLLRLAEKEVETARISLDLARSLLKNEVERLRLGRSTSFQVAQLQQDASLASRQEIRARINYEKTFLALLVLTGSIHEFYGLPQP